MVRKTQNYTVEKKISHNYKISEIPRPGVPISHMVKNIEYDETNHRLSVGFKDGGVIIVSKPWFSKKVLFDANARVAGMRWATKTQVPNYDGKVFIRLRNVNANLKRSIKQRLPSKAKTLWDAAFNN